MNKTKHTEGPWSVEDTGDPVDTLDIVAGADREPGDWQFVGLATSDEERGVDWGQTIANAHLMAAAPEQNTALADLVEWAEAALAVAREQQVLGWITHEEGLKRVAKGHAALKKAKGEQP
jgi:hypothetical protein